MVTRIKGFKKAEIPKTIAKATEVLKQMGEAQDSIDEIEDKIKKQIDEANAKIEEMRVAVEQEVAKLVRERDKRYSLLEKYALPRKRSLTSETRVERTEAGKFGWRYSPPFVQIADGVKVADVIADCKRLGFPQFVRTTEMLNKKAILALKTLVVIPGLSIVQDDEFFAQPKSKRSKKKNKTVIANV